MNAIVYVVQARRRCIGGSGAYVGGCDFALAGGAENMSRSPYIVPNQRWGAKMGDIRTMDMMLGALTVLWQVTWG